MIKAIIFDIGGVVTFTNFQELYTNFAHRVGLSSEVVSKYHSDHWSEMLLGNITLEGFFQDMRDAGATKELNLAAVWLEEALKIRRLNTKLLKIIADLRKKYIVGVLTNLTPTRLMVDRHMGIYDNFEFVICSCETHLKKPDHQFYDLAIQKAGVKSEEAVFIDDKERNIIAAREFGLKDILYTNNQKLIIDLNNLGITVGL